MRTKVLQVLIAVLLVAGSVGLAALPAQAQSTLVYSEEFSGTSVPSPWYPCPIWYNCTTGGRTDQSVYAQAWFVGSAVTVPGDGSLHLTASKRATPATFEGLTFPYNSGYTQTGGYAYNTSIPKKWFTYGYFEARLKCPAMLGAWCAFWLWQDPSGSAEIDITETLANDAYTHNINLHGVADFSREIHMSTPNTLWHTYAVDWQPGYIKWYLDDQLVATYTGTAFNNKSLYLIFNLQLGGTWAGPVDESKLPAAMLVDFVRVYDTRPTGTTTYYTISGNAGVSGATLAYTDGTQKTATSDASGNYSIQVPSGWSGTVTPSRSGVAFVPSSRTYTGVTSNKTGENYTLATSSTTFVDVPADYSETLGGVTYLLYPYIEALYDAGFTGGCSTSPLAYCPTQTLNRASSAVFMLRGLQGTNYAPPGPPFENFTSDDWSKGAWARPWAESMYEAGLTAGCSTDPLKFCPWDALTRTTASVFGLRLKYGAAYTPPPATGTVFYDLKDVNNWATAWAEQAYRDGLLTACGTRAGKPKFCPTDPLNRAWSAYLLVKALDLPVNNP